MWKHRIGYLVFMAAALIAYILADRPEALAFLCLLVLMPLLGGGLQWAAMAGSEVQCRAPATCRMGQKVAVRFTLRRKSRLPLGPVGIRVIFENILYEESRELKLRLQPGEEREMTFVHLMDAEDCGDLKIRGDLLECADLLGLFAFKRPAAIFQEILIYPPELKLHAELAQKPETKNFGEMYDPYKKGQDVSEVSGLRDYVPGDSMNSIHWKLSGKLDQLIVREFGRPSHYNTLILYEMVKRSGELEIPRAFNNAALALTVSLSLSLLELNLEHNVGRVIGGELQAFPVSSMGAHEQMQLSLLCTPIAGEGNGADTAYSLRRGNIRGGYTKIIYITPFYEENTARQLSQEADLTVIQIVQGKGMDYTASAGYALISVDVDAYQDIMHSMTI